MSQPNPRSPEVALALYRTYRPGTLAAVIGQEHVTLPLARAVDSGKAHHAYLLTGPRGCGKTSSARILARCLNCEQGPTSTPCGTCESCVALAPNGPGSVDVVEIDAATHGGVEEARELRERAMYAPVSARFRVYIIDEAHQLSNAAANALLKLIEEPPAHLKFVFATTEPDKIIGTIRSRTHHYPFRLIPVRTLVKHLAWVCDQENISYDDGSLTAIARAAAGSARDALSILGQVASGASDAGLVEAEVVAQLGVTDRRLLDAVVDSLVTGDGAAMFATLDSVIDGGIEPRRFAGDLLERLRDVVVLATVPGAATLGLIDAPDDAIAVMTRQAADLGPQAATHAAAMVSHGLGELRGAMAPRLQLELLCARLLAPGVGVGADALASRIENIERRLDGVPVGVSGVEAARAMAAAAAATPTLPATPSSPAAPGPEQPATSVPATVRAAAPTQSVAAPVAAPATSAATSAAVSAPVDSSSASRRPAPPPPISRAKSAPAPVVAAPAAAPPLTPSGSVDVAEIISKWDVILDVVRSSSRVTWALLNGAAPLSADDAGLKVGLANDALIRNAMSRDAHAALAAAISSVCGVGVNVLLVVSDAPAPVAALTETEGSETGGASMDDDSARAAPSGVDLITSMFGGTVLEEYDQGES